MTHGDSVKSRLREGDAVLGCWLWLFSPIAAEIEKVERAAHAAGKALGCIATPERDEAALLAAGYRFLLCDGDSLLLRDAAQRSVARQRKALGR